MSEGKKNRLGEDLVERGFISAGELQEALARQKIASQKIGQVLVSHGYLHESHLKKVLAEQKQFRVVNLRSFEIPTAVRQVFPQNLAEEHHVVPIEIREGFSMVLAMEDPENKSLIRMLQSVTRLYIEPVLAGHWEIQTCLMKNYYGPTKRVYAEAWHREARPGRSQVTDAPLTFDLQDIKVDEALYDRLMDAPLDFADEKTEEITQETSQPMHHYFPKRRA